MLNSFFIFLGNLIVKKNYFSLVPDPVLKRSRSAELLQNISQQFGSFKKHHHFKKEVFYQAYRIGIVKAVPKVLTVLNTLSRSTVLHIVLLCCTGQVEYDLSILTRQLTDRWVESFLPFSHDHYFYFGAPGENRAFNPIKVALTCYQTNYQSLLYAITI